MNLTKKLLSLFMAFVMAFALVTPIKAESYTIEVNNTNSGHTYEAYQIFTGDLSTKTVDGKEVYVLSNVKWADGVTAKEGELPDAIETAKALENGTLALADLLATINLGALDATDDYDDNKYELTGLTAGYYLVKDADTSLTLDYDAYTDYIVKVVGNVKVNPKSIKPEVDKQVWDEPGDAEGGVADGWNETADHDIKEVFQFKLIATLPVSDEYKAYDTYRVIFKDQMTKGITYVGIKSVVADDVTLTTEQYSVTKTVNEDGTTDLTITIADVKTILGDKLLDGAKITVIYDAYLNEDAKLNNVKENKNTVYLQYSNNPSVSGSGDNYTGGEGTTTPDDNDNELGETPKDSVWVFTYTVDITKVDGATVKEGQEPTKLAGAQFKLSKKLVDGTVVYLKVENGKVKEWTTSESATVLTSGEDGKIVIIGLDHGEYELTEIVAPTGYNLLKDSVKIKINAEHNESTDEASAETIFRTDSTTIVQVANNKGATLPETGGMGTTILYVVGGLLAVLSAVLLITKKRVNG